MLAAVKAKGTTIIEKCMQGTRVVNVAMFLNNMGARIIELGRAK